MSTPSKSLTRRVSILVLSTALATMPMANAAEAKNALGKLLVGGAVGYVAATAIANQRAEAARQQATLQQRSQARQRAAQPVAPTRRAAAPAPQQSFATERTALTQEYLNDLGFDAGPIDGLTGSKTRRAVAEFQANAGYPATGRLTPNQFEVLKQKRTALLAPSPKVQPSTAFAPTRAPSRAVTDIPIVASTDSTFPAFDKLTFSGEVGSLLSGQPEYLKASIDGQRLAERMFTAYHRSYAAQCGAFLDASSTTVQSRVDGGAIPIRSDYAALFAYLDAKTDGSLPQTTFSDPTGLQSAVDGDMSLVLQVNGCASADTLAFERSLLKAITV